MAHILSTASAPVEIRVDIFVKPIVARRRKKENSDGLSRYNIPDDSPAAPNRRSAIVMLMMITCFRVKRNLVFMKVINVNVFTITTEIAITAKAALQPHSSADSVILWWYLIAFLLF